MDSRLRSIRRGTLPSGPRLGGLAGNTAILHLRLRSGEEHCQPELAVEDEVEEEDDDGS